MAIEMTAQQRRQLRTFAPDHLRAIESMATSKKKPTVVEAPEFTLDLSDMTERLTVGDMEDIEKASGIPAFEIFTTIGKNVGGMAGIIWVLRRKEDPAFTYKQARDLPLKTLLAAMSGASQEDDTAPLDESALPSA